MRQMKLNGAVLAFVVAGIALIAAPRVHAVTAFTDQQKGREQMVDARVNRPAVLRKGLATRGDAAERGLASARRNAEASAQAAAQLERTVPGLEVRYGGPNAAAALVRNNRGALTEPSTGRREEIARSFLRENGDLYGLSAADVADIVVLGDSAGGRRGLAMLRVEQQISGVPIFQSETRFLFDRTGRLVQTTGEFVPHAREIAPNLLVTAFMEPQAAVVKLLGDAGITADAASFAVSGTGEGNRLTLSESDGFVAGEITARKVLFPLAPGVLVPAWSLVVFTVGDADWYAVVDAQNGDVLWRKNIREYASAHDARFRVYVQADGVTPAASPAPNTAHVTVVPGSGTQFTEIAPTIVSMHTAYDPVASPNGWINDCPGGVCTANESQTLGNNVVACLDRAGSANVCDTDAASVLDGNGRPTGNPDANARDRDFLGTAPRDFQTGYLPPPQAGNPEAGQTATGNGNNGTLAIDQYRRGVATHLFYTTNWYHDQLYALGFDEASANFQATNFSGFGVGNDRIAADVQDSSGTNNANFSTPPDGTSGRMQMFRFTGPTIDRDGSLDADISIHEMTHGTSNRLVGNAAGLNWDAARGMGEGWSDFYALSLLNHTNADDPNAPYATGGYGTYKFAGIAFLDNYLYGIRRFPYSTNNTVNPMTWADVDDVTNDLSGGIAADPIGFNGSGAFEVHNIGEVWALTLWEVRSRMIADAAGANGDVPTGNLTMLQLTTDALKMTPINPGFIEARDAFFAADCATNACANEGSIWGGFADRGLGYRANSPYRIGGRYAASHSGVQESFSAPYLDVANPLTDVTVNDTATNNNGAVDPGEVVKITVALTNPWRAASKAVASATATLSTSTAGVTIYDNSATYGAMAPQGSATGDSFTFGIGALAAGAPIDFTITTTSSLGTTAATFRMRVGKRNGTDPEVTYTADPNPDLTITNNRKRGTVSQLTVTDDYEIADVDFRVDNATSPAVGDLSFMLRSPEGIGGDLIVLIDGLNDLGGASIVNMEIDDDVTNDAAHDMVQATSASTPYTGSWLPVYNAAWAALVDPTRPADTVPFLSHYDGRSTKGVWSSLGADIWSAASGGTDGNGTFGGWSLLVTPVHFDVAAFVGSVSMTATKTVSGAFQVGGTVTYTVTLTNNGTANQADNVGNEFTDVLPAGLTLVSANATTGTAATAANTVTWNGSVAPLGGTVTITITATVNAGAQNTVVSNQGTVSYDANADGTNDATLQTDDPAVGGATDPTVFAVLGTNVTATKTVTGTFAVGGAVTYTVTLSNSGNAGAPNNAGNEFTDVLPAGLTLVSATASSGTAIATVGTNTVTWNGPIAAAGSVTITINATVNAGNAGATISNQGSFAYDSELNGTNETNGLTDDPSVVGATNPTSFAVVSGPVVTATKTVSGSVAAGSTVTYTVTLSNTGGSAQPDNAGADFTDVLPVSLTLVSASASAGTPAINVPTRTVIWDGSIPAAGSVTITITATINAVPAGTTISNQGSFAYDPTLAGTNGGSGVTDNPGTATANDATSFVVNGALLSATKTVSGTFTAGSTVTYTITLANSGNIAVANNAGNEFTDILPSTLTLVSASATSGTAAANVPTRTVTWDGSIAAGGSVTITIQATVNAAAPGQSISNQGTASYDADGNGSNETSLLTDDPVPAGATDPTTFVVSGAAVTATKTVSGSFTIGGTVTYTITLSNSGNLAAADNAGNEFTDVLPATLTLVSASATSGSAVATVPTRTVTWNGAVAAAGSVTITIQATVNAAANGQTVSNQGTVSFDSNANGSNESSASTDDPAVAGASNVTSFAVASPVLSATKTVTGSFVPGGNVVYTITISNTGAAATLNNVGNEFSDVLSPNLTLVSATATGGTAVATVATNTVTWNGTIAASSSVTITINATIAATASSQTISNQGTISYDVNLDGTNETTVVTDNPATPAALDATSFAVAAAVSAIPALSDIGLLLMLLGLAIVAVRIRLS